MPRHAVPDHLPVDVPVTEVHVPQDPTVTVLLGPLNPDFLFVDLRSQGFPRLGAESLLLLRSVDSVQPDLVLTLS